MLWWALVVVVLSGFLMIFGDPVRKLINPIFWIKMGLVVFGVLIAIWFHKGVLKHVAAGREIVGRRQGDGAFSSSCCGCVIMLCGRWIAYAPV